VEAFGEVIVINDQQNNGIEVNRFETETAQQDAYYDNILYFNTSVNQPPIAVDDSATTNEDTPVIINIIENDIDTDGTIDPATVAIITNPAHGNVVINGDGTVTYTPASGFNGTDTFTYTVQDDDGATSNEATVTVTVSTITYLFSDDFSTDTTANYTVTNTWTEGGTGDFLYDAIGKRAQVLTGDNIGLQFSHELPTLASGSFSIDFLPTKKYPSGGWISLRLIQDQNNYYELYNTDGYGPGGIKKVIDGQIIASASFQNGYTQNNKWRPLGK